MDFINIDELGALSDFMDKKGISVLEVERDGDSIKKIRMEKAARAAAPVIEAREEESAELEKEVSGKPVKSPMVGVFYSASAPEENPYVHVGDKVKKGDVLCVIEAMKLFNEITADEDGEIVKICVSDGQVVEYGQCLFLMK